MTGIEPPTMYQLADWLKVLAEPRRLQILNLLMAGVQCNCELGAHLDLAPNLISHHLSVLRKAGLVEVERDAGDARWVYYAINRPNLEALTTAFASFFDPARILPRQPSCGPQAAFVSDDLILGSYPNEREFRNDAPFPDGYSGSSRR